MDARTLHNRLAALLIGVLVAVAVVVGVCVALPAQAAHDERTEYGYVYSGAKSSSVDFVRSNLGEDSLLVLGSSEFSTPASSVPQIPAQVFGTHNYGLRLMLVGEAFDQCLWDTIALGALADGGLPHNKVAVIVGLGQCTDGGLDASTFGTRFSYSLYEDFCANKAIPQTVRARVQERLAEQGIDQTTIRAGSPQNPIDALDGAALGVMDDLKLRNELGNVRGRGVPLADGAVERPDWESLRNQALEDASRMSTTNEWGVEDAFYTQQLEPAFDSLKGARAGETYTKTPEYDDFDMFLTTCEACGVTPLVVVQPSLGPYYDHIGIDRETRESAYQRLRDVVAKHPNARIADFSDREYEKYFLFDIVHFGWTGWIAAEQALYDFVEGA
ncbi:MAG: D-alanyl-lipoteichoic acid biosynthesis protein DltD [Atopobiaceae bacterium]|nr:D-alanyl-lipoteichoic acid biosynthesis protein DltD [Atopobiaceae bacterium]